MKENIAPCWRVTALDCAYVLQSLELPTCCECWTVESEPEDRMSFCSSHANLQWNSNWVFVNMDTYHSAIFDVCFFLSVDF